MKSIQHMFSHAHMRTQRIKEPVICQNLCKFMQTDTSRHKEREIKERGHSLKEIRVIKVCIL